MKIAIASDHAGFALKEELKTFLGELGHEVEDFGAHAYDPEDDYPDFIVPVAKAVAEGRAKRGIVIGLSGQGEAMAANRIRGVRAALFTGQKFPLEYYTQSFFRKIFGRAALEKPKHADLIALSRRHNDANMLSLGAGFITPDEAKAGILEWLEVDFSDEDKHMRRNRKLDTIEPWRQ